MEIRKITEDYSVAPQITAEDVLTIKQAGFRSLICNRPDDEQPGQPEADTIREAAEKAGLQFRFIPVVSGAMTPDNVSDMADALDELPTPVL
ncbi:MAG TPA: TIGR01244 family sulfur transferase, partial [Rhizobiaceae bacterium]|nr:TIGR01244 family sulfur transferase [Rhizobiaceae bacterium]